MSVDYQRCISVLQLNSGASWEELRKNYKRLVQDCHPDRYQQNTAARKDAEIRSRSLNAAYQALAEYYKVYGWLPVIDVQSVFKSQYQNTTDLGDETPGCTNTEERGILHYPSKVVYTFLRRAIEIEIGIAIVIEMK